MIKGGSALHFPGRIGLGTSEMGASPAERNREIGAVTHALEIGYRLLDTAEMYADGGAERIIGDAIKAFGAARRSELFIVSKFVAENASRSGIARACEASIERMGCDYIDLYLLHWPGQHPFNETIQGFNDLLQRGLIRHSGVSNLGVNDLQKWLKAEKSLGLTGTAPCNQLPYSADARGIEPIILPWQRAHGIQTMAYSPLGRGVLPRHPLLVRLGRELGVSAAQVALAWCIREPDIVAIPKSADPRRIEENLRATELQLSPENLRQIDQAFPLRFRWLRQLRWLHRLRTAARGLIRRVK